MTEDIPAEPAPFYLTASYGRPPKLPNLNSAQLILFLLLLLLSLYVSFSKSGLELYEAICRLSDILG